MNAPSADPVTPVAVVMEWRDDHGNRWLERRWSCVGVACGAAYAAPPADAPEPAVIHRDAHGEQWLWRGLAVRLYRDELESYYQNLMGAAPGVFVVTRPDARGDPYPWLVTLCYDQAGNCMEVDETVHKVAMPPELYRWLEAYVLAGYAPEPRHKRQRT